LIIVPQTMLPDFAFSFSVIIEPPIVQLKSDVSLLNPITR
jgi:hypothetical protein